MRLTQLKIALIGLPFVLFHSTFSRAGQFIEVKDCKISFSTIGQPVLVKIEGVSESPCIGRLEIDDSGRTSGKLSMDLSKIDTGIGLRNKHLRENYLHIEKHPTAELSSIEADSLIQELKNPTGNDQAFKAQLGLHGVSAPIRSGTYRVTKKGGLRAFSARFLLDLPDHGIERPSFMGVKVVDAVDVQVTFHD